MNKSICVFLGVLLFGVSLNTNALEYARVSDEFYQHMDGCDNVAKIADAVMDGRQGGVSKESQQNLINEHAMENEIKARNGEINEQDIQTLRAGSELVRFIIDDAYQTPIMDNAWGRNQVVMNYKIWWFLKCGEGYEG